MISSMGSLEAVEHEAGLVPYRSCPGPSHIRGVRVTVPTQDGLRPLPRGRDDIGVSALSDVGSTRSASGGKVHSG